MLVGGPGAWGSVPHWPCWGKGVKERGSGEETEAWLLHNTRLSFGSEASEIPCRCGESRFAGQASSLWLPVGSGNPSVLNRRVVGNCPQ